MNLGEQHGGPSMVVDRGEGVNGELVLRSDGADLEVVANGVFLMDTRVTVSERAMVRDTLAHVGAGARLLVGGLGVGSSVHEALVSGAGEIDVVEIEPLVITWWERWFRAYWGLSTSQCRRVRIVPAALQDYVRTCERTYDAIVLDTDNGPEWLVTSGNAPIYALPALRRVARLLAPGGRCVYWSASPSAAFEERLRQVYADVVRHDVPRGDVPPDVLYACERPILSSPSSNHAGTAEITASGGSAP
ncbi:spermidine synthase [Arsenicicoccus dermatophilus]|uniref:spermidine synthase n=1 Tax=Arsenicicoccus dermatophilus TaxID=1076331 RepID=UPI001F4CFA8F|nr:hypothetical protein [Arsenicicoccus dermatophilus]MCH8611912.1 hypothetical protein [Arsenicicoccus dermatophilus]